MSERKGRDVIVVMFALTSCRIVIFYLDFLGISREEAKRKHQRNNGKTLLVWVGIAVFKKRENTGTKPKKQQRNKRWKTRM